MNRSSDPRLASAGLFSNPAFLRSQFETTWAKEFDLLTRLGGQDGMTVVDLGAGPGYALAALLERWPHSPAVAVDLDPDMCALAREELLRCSEGRVRVLQESASNTSLPDESCDLVLIRFLLQHVPAPDLVLDEAFRLLAPGGIIFVLDVDDGLSGLVQPTVQAMGPLLERVRELQRKGGGRRTAGRHLWRWLRDAGCEEVTLHAILANSDELGLEALLEHYRPERFQALVGTAGGLSQDEWESYRAGYATLAAASDAFILHLLLAASGRKTPAA